MSDKYAHVFEAAAKAEAAADLAVITAWACEDAVLDVVQADLPNISWVTGHAGCIDYWYAAGVFAGKSGLGLALHAERGRFCASIVYDLQGRGEGYGATPREAMQALADTGLPHLQVEPEQHAAALALIRRALGS